MTQSETKEHSGQVKSGSDTSAKDDCLPERSLRDWWLKANSHLAATAIFALFSIGAINALARGFLQMLAIIHLLQSSFGVLGCIVAALIGPTALVVPALLWCVALEIAFKTYKTEIQANESRLFAMIEAASLSGFWVAFAMLIQWAAGRTIGVGSIFLPHFLRNGSG